MIIVPRHIAEQVGRIQNAATQSPDGKVIPKPDGWKYRPPFCPGHEFDNATNTCEHCGLVASDDYISGYNAGYDKGYDKADP